MPACLECSMLNNNKCEAHHIAEKTLGRGSQLQPPPIGACMIPIVEAYLDFIKPRMRVLEIGCGSWSRIKDRCEQIGAKYEGTDVQTEYMGLPTIASRIENLAELSFADEFFDIVVGNQTMEHWAENKCTLPWGIYQCFRVCKPNGRILMNVPIHFHGTKEFRQGQINKLKLLFSPFSNQVSFFTWGYPSKPLPAFSSYPGYWSLKGKYAYQLDIQAIKDRPLPQGYSNRGAARGRLSQLVNYAPSYNLYRLFRRLGFYNYDPILE